jgi:hypothetical protein
MPIEVTEDYDGTQYSLKSPWRASRRFMVSGTTDALVALGASDPLTGVSIPQKNNSIRPGSSLLCEGPEIEQQVGPDLFGIRCDYSIPPAGEHPENNDDPLLQPTVIRWRTLEAQIPVDVDLDGRAIVNAAGEAYDGVSRRVTWKQLTIIRPEPFYDIAKCEQYENRYNSEPVNLSGIISAPAHKMRCNSIEPAADYNPTSPVITMAYIFEIFLSNILGPYPFQHAFLNAGGNGWYTRSSQTKMGRFVTQGSGNELVPFSGLVRLNLAGVPLPNINDYAQIKVDGGGLVPETPVAKPDAVAFWATETLSQTATGSLTTGHRVYYKACEPANFNLLGL